MSAKYTSTDSLTAFEELKNRVFRHESVDVYLADIKRLSKIVDPDISEKFLCVAFLAGLPDQVKKQIRATSVSDDLVLEDYVEIARKLVATPSTCMAAVQEQSNSSIVCFECGVHGHTRRTCPKLESLKCVGCEDFGHTVQNCRRKKKCFICGDFSHLANACPRKRRQKNE